MNPIRSRSQPRPNCMQNWRKEPAQSNKHWFFWWWRGRGYIHRILRDLKREGERVSLGSANISNWLIIQRPPSSNCVTTEARNVADGIWYRPSIRYTQPTDFKGM